MNYPRLVGIGNELAHATKAQTSREVNERLDAIVEGDSNNEYFSVVANDLCNTRCTQY